MLKFIRRLRAFGLMIRVHSIDTRCWFIELRRDLNIRRAERLDNRAARLMKRSLELYYRAKELLK